jgi:hypothetical protein
MTDSSFTFLGELVVSDRCRTVMVVQLRVNHRGILDTRVSRKCQTDADDTKRVPVRGRWAQQLVGRVRIVVRVEWPKINMIYSI